MKKALSLKAQNVKQIGAVILADALLLGALAFPATLAQAATVLAGVRIAGATITPLIVLLLTSLLSADVKAILVYWRVRDVLPGHRAFSVYALKDSRIDIERLRAVVEEFPTSPRDENIAWYRLFKQVESDTGVAQAHRAFLLFRDLAALSFLLAVAAPIALLVIGAASELAWIAVGVIVTQFIATAGAARFNGERFVCNVLALHGAASEPKAKRQRSPHGHKRAER